MKPLLALVFACLFAACSKDDDSAATPAVSTPELEMWVYSNHKFPYLKYWEDTVLVANINYHDSQEQVTPVYYSKQTLKSGYHIFRGDANNFSSQNDTLMLDTFPVWVRLVVKYKGNILIDSTGIDSNGNGSAHAALEYWN